MKEFDGRTAVITGGASGIGRALADRFAEARMNVVLADIEEDALMRAVNELEQRQVRVLGVVTDTMRRQSIENLLETTLAEFGKVHVLCNNAGVANTGGGVGQAVWETPQADWDWVMGVNFNGVLYGIQTFVPHMLEHGEPGHVVNTASLAGLLPTGGPYGVSKHAVLALTEGLHRDLAQRGAAIGASVLCPGFVDTNIFDAERNRPDGMGGGEIDPMAAAIGKALLAGGKQPAEIAESVFQAIREERCYILPHPAWDDIVRRRVDAIIERGAPMAFDPGEIMKRRAAGEVM